MTLPVIRSPCFTRRLRLFPQGTTFCICLTVGIFFLLARGTVFAESTAPTTENDAPFLDTTHKQASATLLNTAYWLDDFFNDDRVISEENKTRIKLELGFGYSRNETFEIKPTISGKIDLPHLGKRVNLLIFVSKNDDFATEKNPVSTSLLHQGSDKPEIATGLQYFLQEGQKYNISTTLSASLHYLSAGIRYRYFQDFGLWQGRFVNRLQYFTDDGGENSISYDLEHYFSNQWLFRTTVAADWLFNKDGVPHSLLFRLYQILNEEKAMLYEVAGYFNTENSYKMIDLQLSLRYRQRFLRDWLVLEVAPQVSFPEDHDRKINPGFIIKFEADFGNISGRDIFSGIFSL